MVDTTEIEKKSLEAHVELCAERYKFLEEKMESIDLKVTSVATSVTDVKNTVESMAIKSNDRLINWGVGVIVTLMGVIGWLLQHYVLN